MLSKFQQCMGIISAALMLECPAAIVLYLTFRCRDRTSLFHLSRRYIRTPLASPIQTSLTLVSLPSRGLYESIGLCNNITGILCQGAGGQDYANITNFAAVCGLMYGAPRRHDGSASLIFDPGSSWTIPMYSCISATKALVKTVSFRFNGSDDLSGLTVTSLTDKVYPNDTSKPLWGVEDTQMALADVKPLWGLVATHGRG